MLSSYIQCYFVLIMKSLDEKENLFVISTLMDIQGIEPWTSRMRSVRATTVPNAHTNSASEYSIINIA